MPSTPTPHNDFFYQVMSRKEQATSFFSRYLPADIRSQANLQQLELIESKHISDHGTATYNDILYRCPLSHHQVGYFFAMCEHQSTPHPQMPLRLLRYTIDTIEQHLKQGGQQFPIVLHTVLYHGKRPWNYSTSFVDYYANPKLGARYLYLAPFTLVNLPQQPAEVIYSDPSLGFCFEAFRATSTPDPFQSFAKALESSIFHHHIQNLPTDLKNILLAYLGNCIDTNAHNLEEVVTLITTNTQEKDTLMTSIAQHYQAKGIQQGMQQGMQQEKRLIAKNLLLQLHLGMDDVQKATGLSRATLEALRKSLEER